MSEKIKPLCSEGLNELIKLIKSALDGKSNKNHTHDDRYYTKSEIEQTTNKYHGYSGVGSGSTAADAKAYFEDESKVPNGTVKTVYESAGDEYTLIFSKSASGACGTILKWGYGDSKIRILRLRNRSWLTEDWEVVSTELISDGSATFTASDISNNFTNLNNTKQDAATAVKKRENGYSYTQLGSYYSGGYDPNYIRIAIPKKDSTWTMCTLEITVKQSYSSAYFGKILVHGNWSSGNEWNNLYVTVHGRLSNNIKVYGSDKTYIYIDGCEPWCTLTVDKMLIGDNATYYDLSDVTIDSVESLPEVYQTAEMIYDINTENIGSQSVNYANSSNSSIYADVLSGFQYRPTSIGWGTLSGSDYTYISRMDTANGGSVAFADKSGQTYFQIDGFLYQNEGRYMCLDTNNCIPIINDKSLPRLGWWSSIDTSKNADDLRNGYVFAYSTHNAPDTGTLVAFNNGENPDYVLQIMGGYATNELWYRNKNGDTNEWLHWKRILTTSDTVNELTSDSIDAPLSAAQGKALKALVDGKANSSHTHTIANVTGLQSALDSKMSNNVITGSADRFSNITGSSDNITIKQVGNIVTISGFVNMNEKSTGSFYVNGVSLPSKSVYANCCSDVDPLHGTIDMSTSGKLTFWFTKAGITNQYFNFSYIV